jgi:hypothetical protein
MSDVISSYLLELNESLGGFWPGRRRLLDEVRSHLEESAFHGVDAGLAEEDAERQAVTRFGDAKKLALQFAEERLTASNTRAFHGLLPLLAATWACLGVEGLFPVAARFHEAATPELVALGQAAHLALFLTLPLLALTVWLRRQPNHVYGASNALLALFIAIILGCEGVGLARHCEALWTQGADSIAPFEIRLLLVVVAICVQAPAVLAHDAFASTRHRVA